MASILVIAEFTIPLLAMLALKKLVDQPELLKTHAKWLYTSFALTAGVALLFALMPKLFFPDYVSSSEMQAMSQIPADQLAPLLQNLTEMRVAVFTADCWRSFWIIVIGTAFLLLFRYQKVSAGLMVGCLVVLCLVDMWQVNKRYLNDGMFVSASVREEPMQKSAAIDHILQDKAPDFRVLNLATSTFNENETSFYLKSIGGYHAAKLRRYQELIDAHIQPEMQWLFGAVADRKFREQLGDAVAQDTLSRVTLKSYEPNQLTYEVNSDKGGVVVFSEIYYPGWTATVDGQEQELGRVNYVLRALRVSPGSHEVVLSFFPKSIDRTETVAYAAYVALLLILLFLGWNVLRRRGAHTALSSPDKAAE